MSPFASPSSAEVFMPLAVMRGFRMNTKCPRYRNGIRSITKSLSMFDRLIG